jgi:DNA (cytosine-5)-methyltransferase 1
MARARVKRLSEAQASRCEHATRPRCKCRCGGVLHGASRGAVAEFAPVDPHYAPSSRPVRLFDVAPLELPWPPLWSSPVAGSLFTGIGGLDLGLERAGWRIAWQSEIEPYCCRVLNARWPTVPNLGDVATVNFEEVEPVELIAGGYPCQPFSVAGKQAGTDDPRYLWPHFARALRLLRPRFALLENVPGHLANGFGDVLADLAALGYDAEWESVPAEAFGAPHLRWRVFVVAYTDGRRRQGRRVAQPARVEGPPRDLADRPRPVRVFDDAPAGADADGGRGPWRRRATPSAGQCSRIT